MSKIHGVSEAALAVLVRDESQGQGLGKELYRRLLQVARDEKLKKLHSNMLRENAQGRAMCQALGFKFSDEGRADNIVLAELTL
jgi:acetyltransferase